MNSLNVFDSAPGRRLLEKFQTRTPMTTSAIQKTRLFSVEFKSAL
jgi:hypothetical protein